MPSVRLLSITLSAQRPSQRPSQHRSTQCTALFGIRTECIIVSTFDSYKMVKSSQELLLRCKMARNTDRLCHHFRATSTRCYPITNHTAGTVNGRATFATAELPGIDPQKIRLRLYHDTGNGTIFSRRCPFLCDHLASFPRSAF